MSSIGIAGNKARLHFGPSNSKVIITAHGGILYGRKKLPSLPMNLHFMGNPNRTTKGKVNSVPYMSSTEFRTESKGTSNVDNHGLSWYQHDTQTQIDDCVKNLGYDVVTITPSRRPTLRAILKVLRNSSSYTDVYCLFCRSPIGTKKVKLGSKNMMAEIKSFRFR